MSNDFEGISGFFETAELQERDCSCICAALMPVSPSKSETDLPRLESAHRQDA